MAADAPTVIGARGHRIGVGDMIISRHNDPTVPVFDRHRHHQTPPIRCATGTAGASTPSTPQHNRIAARRIGDDARAAFSGDYLREHVTHGYAVTVHAAQGETAGDALTAGTAHAVLGDRATRALAYVAMTRGRTKTTSTPMRKLPAKATTNTS